MHRIILCLVVLVALFTPFASATDCHPADGTDGMNIARNNRGNLPGKTPETIMEYIRDCDTVSTYLDFNGRFVTRIFFFKGENNKLNHYDVDSHEVVQAIVRDLHPWYGQFQLLPHSVRRHIIVAGAPLVATYVAENIHPSLLLRYLLDLDWNSDIEPINPDWLYGISWPEDNDEVIRVEGYGSLSRTDCYVRMFWKRRGMDLFFLAQHSLQKVLK